MIVAKLSNLKYNVALVISIKGNTNLLLLPVRGTVSKSGRRTTGIRDYSCKSNYHTITTTTVPYSIVFKIFKL
jgi:hypothetical protein